jgi:ankyrin repeat protein
MAAIASSTNLNYKFPINPRVRKWSLEAQKDLTDKSELIEKTINRLEMVVTAVFYDYALKTLESPASDLKTKNLENLFSVLAKTGHEGSFVKVQTLINTKLKFSNPIVPKLLEQLKGEMDKNPSIEKYLQSLCSSLGPITREIVNYERNNIVKQEPHQIVIGAEDIIDREALKKLRQSKVNQEDGLFSQESVDQLDSGLQTLTKKGNFRAAFNLYYGRLKTPEDQRIYQFSASLTPDESTKFLVAVSCVAGNLLTRSDSGKPKKTEVGAIKNLDLPFLEELVLQSTEWFYSSFHKLSKSTHSNVLSQAAGKYFQIVTSVLAHTAFRLSDLEKEGNAHPRELIRCLKQLTLLIGAALSVGEKKIEFLSRRESAEQGGFQAYYLKFMQYFQIEQLRLPLEELQQKVLNKINSILSAQPALKDDYYMTAVELQARADLILQEIIQELDQEEAKLKSSLQEKEENFEREAQEKNGDEELIDDELDLLPIEEEISPSQASYYQAFFHLHSGDRKLAKELYQQASLQAKESKTHFWEAASQLELLILKRTEGASKGTPEIELLEAHLKELDSVSHLISLAMQSQNDSPRNIADLLASLHLEQDLAKKRIEILQEDKKERKKPLDAALIRNKGVVERVRAECRGEIPDKLQAKLTNQRETLEARARDNKRQGIQLDLLHLNISKSLKLTSENHLRLLSAQPGSLVRELAPGNASSSVGAIAPLEQKKFRSSEAQQLHTLIFSYFNQNTSIETVKTFVERSPNTLFESSINGHSHLIDIVHLFTAQDLEKSLALAKLLLSYPEKKKFLLTQADKRGYTPLHSAVRARAPAMVELILKELWSLEDRNVFQQQLTSETLSHFNLFHYLASSSEQQVLNLVQQFIHAFGEGAAAEIKRLLNPSKVFAPVDSREVSQKMRVLFKKLDIVSKSTEKLNTFLERARASAEPLSEVEEEKRSETSLPGKRLTSNRAANKMLIRKWMEKDPAPVYVGAPASSSLQSEEMKESPLHPQKENQDFKLLKNIAVQLQLNQADEALKALLSIQDPLSPPHLCLKHIYLAKAYTLKCDDKAAQEALLKVKDEVAKLAGSHLETQNLWDNLYQEVSYRLKATEDAEKTADQELKAIGFE